MAYQPASPSTDVDVPHKALLWIEYAYLMRFQITIGLMLVLVLPICYWVVPSIFIGLFDARGFWSLTFIVWAALQLAWTIMVTCRLVLVYGPDRFARAQRARLQPIGTRTVLLFGALGVPCMLITCLASLDLSWLQKIGGIAIGSAIAVSLLCATAVLHFTIEEEPGNTAKAVFPSFGILSPSRSNSRLQLWKWIDSWINKLPRDFTEGIVRNGRLRSGHELAIVALLVFCVCYAVIGIAYSPARVSAERQPAALFYLLFLLGLFTWFLSGAAFVLDRFRLPVFMTLLVVSLVTGFVRTDHQFALQNTPGEPVRGLSPAEVVKHWADGKRIGTGKTIVIVATAGGGIRASAWTAEVLTRLQEHCGQRFSSSLVLVSSVSGGSVGTMFVLAGFDPISGIFPEDKTSLEAIRFNASRSSLSAVGWGLLYPDVARTAPLFGVVVPQTLDRGWAIENAWITGWKKPPNMSNWRRDVSVGSRPAVIFNGTASESGERFVIASTDTSESGTIRFSDHFGGWDIPVTTAARLSATFPYVSPIARPSAGPDEYRLHVADGGYYDNSGVLSAVEWLKEAKGSIRDYQILLIMIDSEPGLPRPGSSWSWQHQISAPLETLLHVRTSSQQFRGALELQMALEYLKQEHIDAKFAYFQFPSSSTVAPLSWHLNSAQIKAIQDAWNVPLNEAGKLAVYDQLGCGR